MKKLKAGRTSRQMINAPQGAIYVWESSDIDYPKRLAHWLHRDDLTIYAHCRLDFCAVRKHVVVDHAAYVTPAQKAMLDRRGSYIKLGN